MSLMAFSLAIRSARFLYRVATMAALLLTGCVGSGGGTAANGQPPEFSDPQVSASSLVALPTGEITLSVRATDPDGDEITYTWSEESSAGTFDPQMLSLVAERGVPFIAMHCTTTPDRMQQALSYGDVVAEVCHWLRGRMVACKQAGIAPENLCVDPGIGFGKHLQHIHYTLLSGFTLLNF